MSPIGGIWAPMALRVMRKAAITTTKMIRNKLAAATRPLNAELQTVPVRAQPVHPKALLRQSQRAGAKWYSTNSTKTVNIHAIARRFISSGPAPRKTIDRSKLPVSTISRAVSQLPGRAPFASTLRPNLTGGALPRTAGGYSATGAGRVGGARYFSHTPAAPAQVVQNVSQAVRAFWLSGQRARFDGVDAKGRSRYVSVSAAQEEMRVKMAGFADNLPGSFVDFKISPTITALSPLGAALAVEGIFGPTAAAEAFKSAGVPAATLNTEGFLDVLSTDFARALKDLSAVMVDLKKLASGLGDLPISMEKNNILRVRFPGVDADTVERLCDDVGVQRGMVGEDVTFRLSQGTLTSPGGSMRSHNSILSEEEDGFLDEFDDNPWLSTASPEEGYESLSPPVYSHSGEHCSEEFEGLEGIYRFLEECDRSRNPF
ncbi:hypothetical protein DL546_001611 [Coniochaeta pulveracea]|uniref:Casein kinase II beta 2 subunit n=1 Tax=Coniochaeta pulveracea TaxID=177199 RepID=A0A420Y2L1_9PEZI|nr:hypothetical protein DL546_001611 [Coniochaeta pulveracea]